jgi:hypothetical protein
MRLIRKLSLGIVLFLVICGVLYFRSHRAKAPLEVGYAANRQVIVWSTTAQVREQVATVGFGDQLQILDRFGDDVQVRTPAGVTGWVSQTDLLSADFWKKTQELEVEASKLPVEARGHTHVISNLHMDPARDSPRIRQLNKDVPVDLIERQVAAVSSPSTPAAAPADAPAPTAPTPVDQSVAPAGAKKEDWWLIRAHLADKTTASGWVLARFIDLDVPDSLRDYASAAAMRIVAWFELSRIATPEGDSKPQYLVVGTHGAEGQPCDFMLLRVYTWSIKRAQYETAYIESNVCGTLPVKVTPVGTSGTDLTFEFSDTSSGVREERVYRMQHTIVKLVRQNNSAAKTRKRAR